MKNKPQSENQEYDEIFTTLQEPYENEHACRLEDPGKYERFARKNGEQEHEGRPIDVIYGIKADGKSEIQGLRYPKGKWSAEDARKHCKSRGGAFEAASRGKGEDRQLNEALGQLHEITETRTCTIEVIEEVRGRPVKIRGCFIDADMFNDSEPRRLYPETVLRKAVELFNEKDTKLGLDGHKFDGVYADVVLLHDRLWLDESKGFFESTIISETDGGRVIQLIAEKKLPITVSLFGLGTEVFDKDATDKQGRIGGYIVQEGYQIERLDAVLNPAFSNAKAMIKESQNQSKEVAVDDKLVAQIKELTEKVTGFEKQITDLNKNAEKNQELIAQLKSDRDKAVAMIEAKRKVKEILESKAEELKDFGFMPQLKEHLELCESPEEVEKNYPRILQTLKRFKGEAKEDVKPSGVVIIEEKGFFGDKTGFLGGKAPNTIEEAYKWLLDKFEDRGPFVHPMDNPRWIADRLLKNQIKLILNGGNMDALDQGVPDGDIFRPVRRNPLYFFTKKGLSEALGDTEAYTSDIVSTGAYLLPLYTWVMKDVMDILAGVAAIQPMDRPEGKAFFLKEYYGDGAGAWSEISANFDKAKGETGEAEAPKLVKVQIDSQAINLGPAIKLKAAYTAELEQDMMAHFGLNCESAHVQLLRNEVAREVSQKMLYYLLTAAATAKGDGLVVLDTVNFSLSPDTGYTGGEWITKGFTRAVKQAGAKMDVDPFNVVPDWIIADSQLSYLFTEHNFVADDSAKKPTTFGFRKIGTFQEEYEVYLTSQADYAGKILLGHRGTAFTDAAMVFLPYVMFYLGSRIETDKLVASRTCMHRSAYIKVAGRKLVRINVVP